MMEVKDRRFEDGDWPIKFEVPVEQERADRWPRYLRRRLFGMSAKYMPPYVAEFQFRYNNRENSDIFGTAISGC
jgi:hypothetical protein